MTRTYLMCTIAALFSVSPAVAAEPRSAPSDKVATLESTTIAMAAAQPDKGPNSSQCKKDKALFDRVGGFFGIAAVVNRFSDAILVNPVLNQNPALAAWNQNEAPTRLPGLKFLRTMWIASMAGGPIKFTGQPLETAHDRFNLTQAQFAEVGSEIVKALQHFQVAQADIDQLVCLYRTSMSDVVSSPEGPRQVTPQR